MRTAASIALVVASLVSACIAYQDVVSSHVGSSEGDLITRWRVPDQTYRADDGARYLTHRSTRTYDATAGVNLHERCVTTFKVAGGKIASASYQGNDCR